MGNFAFTGILVFPRNFRRLRVSAQQQYVQEVCARLVLPRRPLEGDVHERDVRHHRFQLEVDERIHGSGGFGALSRRSVHQADHTLRTGNQLR